MYACGEKVNDAHGYFGTNLNRWGDRVFDPQHWDFGSSWVWQFPPTIPRWKYLHGLKLHYIISLWMRLSEISLVRCGVSFLQICSNTSMDLRRISPTFCFLVSWFSRFEDCTQQQSSANGRTEVGKSRMSRLVHCHWFGPMLWKSCCTVSSLWHKPQTEGGACSMGWWLAW